MFITKKYENDDVLNLFYNASIGEAVKKLRDITTADFSDATAQRDLMLLLETVLATDPYLSSILDIRYGLVSSYEHSNNDWSILTSDSQMAYDELALINRQFASVYALISAVPVNVESFGCHLLSVEIVVGDTTNTQPKELLLKQINHSDFATDEKDKVIYFDNKNDKEVVVNLLGDEKIVPATKNVHLLNYSDNYGGLLLSLAETSLRMQNIIVQWDNYLQKLQGLIAIKYDANKLLDQARNFLMQTSETNTEIENAKVKKTVMDAIRVAEQIGQDIVASIPQGIDIEGKSVTSGSSGQFESYIQGVRVMYETKYLGQSTIAGSGASGSYGTGAGIKAMFTNTLNKERADKSLVVKAFNELLKYYWLVWKGDSIDCPLFFEFGSESNEDVKLNLEVIQALAKLPLSERPKITNNDLYKKFNLPMPATVVGENIVFIG